MYLTMLQHSAYLCLPAQTNAGHHTKEGVLNSIVSVPIQNWMSVVMTVSVGTLKLLVYVSKVG